MDNWYLLILGITLIAAGSFFLLTKQKEIKKTFVEQKLEEMEIAEESSQETPQETEEEEEEPEVEEVKHGFDVSSAFDKFKNKK